MTDNANTFLIYEISGRWDITEGKKELPKKIILNYIADERFPDLFLHEGNNESFGQKYADSQFLGYPMYNTRLRCRVISFLSALAKSSN